MATPTAAAPPAPVAAAGEGERPLALADGVELLGEFEGSGFKETPRLARRADGQIVRLTPLLYAVAAESDGVRDAGAVAAAVSTRCGRGVSAGNVRFLAEKQLRPLGILALPDGTMPEVRKRAPLMALRHRRSLVPARVVGVMARAMAWAHRPAVVLLVLVALGLFDAWLFGVHGLAAPLRTTLYEPTRLLAVLAAIVIATAFHEVGHASACHYGGARPGVMGVGLYLVWPAFYCDVTESYRLGRAGRLRTDLGGVYFNGIFALLMGAAYLATGQEPLLLVAFLQHMLAVQQLLPLLRFDGYYVLSDLTGVPDILSRIKPIFGSLVPWRKPDPAVTELKPWVRVVVTGYLLVLVPLLAFMIGSMVLAAPRVLATTYDSLGLQLDRLQAASGAAELGLGVVRITSLCLPVGAMALSVGRSGRMAGRGLMRWSSGSVPRRLLAAALILGTAVGLASLWWPNGEYQPIRPGERGTIGEIASSFPQVGSGRPSFSEARERLYGPAPTAREQASPPPERAPRGAGGTPDPAVRRPEQEEPWPADPLSDDPDAPGAGAGAGVPTSDDRSNEDSQIDAAAPSGSPQPTTTAPPSATPEPTATPTASATPTPSPTATSTPAATATPTPGTSSTATPTATPTTTTTTTATPSVTP
jgi:putative peptide zinc metalloprotease protein